MKELKLRLAPIGEGTLYGLLRTVQIRSRLVGGKWVASPQAVQDWLNSITKGTGMESDDIGNDDE